MITDISYLEAGFSEEFSSLLNNDENILPVDESQQEESINNTKKHINLSNFEEASFGSRAYNKTVHGSIDNDSYIYAGAYNSYLESSIDNELRLNAVINSYINEEVVLEARIQDDVAKRWDAFLKFMDGILDRFWSAMDKIVNSQKSYLEKYQDIILKKKPKEQITFS